MVKMSKKIILELTEQLLCILILHRGKSGLHRVRRQITSGKRKFTDSATENIPLIIE